MRSGKEGFGHVPQQQQQRYRRHRRQRQAQSYLCLIDTTSGAVLEESRIATSPTAFERRFSGLEPTRVALEAGTHSPWISRLLEGCGHEVLVANARKLRLIYAEAKKTDRLDAENLARLARLDPKLLSPPLAAQAPC